MARPSAQATIARAVGGSPAPSPRQEVIATRACAPWPSGGLLRRVAYSGRIYVSASQALYLPIARHRYRDVPNRVVDKTTELVIDGFQRSANTFAAMAFEVAQPRAVKTAHHLHAVAQFRAGVELGVPCLLLIRDPIDAIVSHLIREPHATPRQAFSSWAHFYERLLPLREAVVVADFREITSDFGATIERVNRRYGTGFAPFEHTPQNVDRVVRLIDERTRARYGAVRHDLVPRPSDARERLKADARRAVDAVELGSWRRRVAETYRTYVTGI